MADPGRVFPIVRVSSVGDNQNLIFCAIGLHIISPQYHVIFVFCEMDLNNQIYLLDADAVASKYYQPQVAPGTLLYT